MYKQITAKPWTLSPHIPVACHPSLSVEPEVPQLWGKMAQVMETGCQCLEPECLVIDVLC